MSCEKLLILGRIPPPIGGVTIHVDRLLHYLSIRKVPYTFLDLQLNNVFLVFSGIISCKTLHIHTSNSKAKFFLVLIAIALNKRVVTTLHTDISRFKGVSKYLEKFVIKYSTVPIVLNRYSLEECRETNKDTIELSAFFPPYKIEKLDTQIWQEITDLKSHCKKIFCTNASRYGIDKNNREIYGIISLLDIFKKETEYGLIVSDSSGQYREFIEKNGIELGDNILLISSQHDFNTVIKATDGMIRFTTVDGDSVSVKEALHFGKQVWASDVVDRPQGVILVKNKEQLAHKLFNEEVNSRNILLNEDNQIDKLIALYNLD